MAWEAEENFNSYSVNGLNGGNGGSGWSGAWSAHANYKIVSANQPPWDSSGKSVFLNSGNSDEHATRALANPVSTGICYVAARTGATSCNQYVAMWRDSGGNTRAYVRFDSSGNIVLNGTNIQSYSINTWYLFAVEFDMPNNRSRVKIKEAGGNWGSWSNWVSYGSGESSIADIRFTTAYPSNNNYWDLISATDPSLPPAVPKSKGYIF